MATKHGNGVVYSIQQTNKRDELTVTEVAKPTVIKYDYDNLVPITIKGQTYLLGYNSKTSDQLDVYQFTNGALWLKAVSAKAKQVPKAQESKHGSGGQ